MSAHIDTNPVIDAQAAHAPGWGPLKLVVTQVGWEASGRGGANLKSEPVPSGSLLIRSRDKRCKIRKFYKACNSVIELLIQRFKFKKKVIAYQSMAAVRRSVQYGTGTDRRVYR